jgi:DNA end-binding protein Ku
MAAIARKMITFSLVSIPVSVHAATSQHRVPLHLVHESDGGRVRQPRVCSLDGKELGASEIARGYELPTGDTLVLTERDLADLPTPDTREIRILGFMPADRVDALHYDRAYYLSAESSVARPYALLREALLQSEQVAIARTALRTRDALAVITVRGDALAMITLLWPDEVRAPAGLAPPTPKLRPEEIELARQLMDAVSEGFAIEEERDEYTQALQEVVEARAAGLPGPHAPEARVLPATAGASDLMAVLEAAVARAQEEHPKAEAGRPAKKAAAKKATRRGTAR